MKHNFNKIPGAHYKIEGQPFWYLKKSACYRVKWKSLKKGEFRGNEMLSRGTLNIRKFLTK